MKEDLRPMALLFKIVAIVIWLLINLYVTQNDIAEVRATSQPTYRDAPADWGTPEYKRRMYTRITVAIVLAIMAFIPNIILVFSIFAFIPAILISMFPFLYSIPLLLQNVSNTTDAMWRLIPLTLTFIVFLPLPLSIFLSWLRKKRGERVLYA